VAGVGARGGIFGNRQERQGRQGRHRNIEVGRVLAPAEKISRTQILAGASTRPTVQILRT
jgi:hypothetical protein